MKIKPTYEDLLQIIKEQEVVIKELNDERYAITNFEFFVKESPDLICIADSNAYFRVINDGFAKALGYSKEELLSHPFLSFVHPDDLERTLEEVKHLTRNHPTVDFENRYINKKGDVVYFQWKANLNTINNLIYAIARDVTEIRKTQEKLLLSEKSLNESQRIAKIGSWDFNLATQELSWSNTLYEIFEVENDFNASDLYAKFLSSFLPEDEAVLHKNIEKTISDKVSYEMEHPIIVGNQKLKWVFCTGLPVMDNNDNVIGLKGVVQDITQKKLIDDTIKAKENAEAANKAKSDFLANMTHEIRTPLNGIVGFTDLLLKTKFDDVQLEYLKTVNESANTLMEIVNNILDFSKIESGKIEFNLEDIDLIQSVKQIVNLFKHEANNKKIELILEIDSNVPNCIKGDSFRLKQILANLLSNALKFTFEGFVKVRVSLVGEEDLIYRIKFSVQDSGIGIKIENQKKIFKSFIQADNTTTRKYGGTGLGLAISSQLLALKGSELELRSTFGEGSEFFFTVAFDKVVQQANDSKTNDDILSEPSSKLPVILSGFKILIAEDNKINMLLAKTLINKIIKNCNLIEAVNGEEAVTLTEIHQPDLILMDIQMPVQNGYDASIEIRKNENFKEIPIIALTAGVLNGEKEKCFESGMSDYVSKPIIQSELEKVLLKWLI